MEDTPSASKRRSRWDLTPQQTPSGASATPSHVGFIFLFLVLERMSAILVMEVLVDFLVRKRSRYVTSVACFVCLIEKKIVEERARRQRRELRPAGLISECFISPYSYGSVTKGRRGTRSLRETYPSRPRLQGATPSFTPQHAGGMTPQMTPGWFLSFFLGFGVIYWCEFCCREIRMMKNRRIMSEQNGSEPALQWFLGRKNSRVCE